jgi:hypothetical protein
MKVLDLFSGIGGFSLGLERAGMQTLAFCESDPDCVAVLRDQWPHVPVFGDVRSLAVEPGFVDLICGGFPCQPFSTAARGRNRAIDLWPEFLRSRPSAQIRLGSLLKTYLESVMRASSGCAVISREAGYYVWPFDLDTALPQRQRGRHRIIWLAHTNRKGEPRFAEHAGNGRPIGAIKTVKRTTPRLWEWMMASRTDGPLASARKLNRLPASLKRSA